MKRITTVLRESEAMAVRKAVCVAGGERVVITPIPYWMCRVDMADLDSEKKIATESNKYVRLDVTAEDSCSVSIVSSIRRISHAGKIALASLHSKLTKRAA
jgi:hypothetical protein